VIELIPLIFPLPAPVVEEAEGRQVGGRDNDGRNCDKFEIAAPNSGVSYAYISSNVGAGGDRSIIASLAVINQITR